MSSFKSTILGNEPLTVAEIKAHLKILHNAEDTLLQSYISSARAYAEQYMNRGLIFQTITQVIDSFPDNGMIELRYGPAVELTSLKYIDADGAEQTFADTNYNLDNVTLPSRIILKDGKSFPTIADQKAAITIVYKVGYETISDCPEIYKNALKLMVGDMYANREDVTRNFATLSDKLLRLYRIHYYE